MSEERKSKKFRFNFLGISIILASLILGGSIIYAFHSLSQIIMTGSEVAQEETEELAGPEIGELAHVLGDSSALVTLVEFSDFQCPYCSRFHFTVAQVMNDYSTEVRWAFKHFPIDSLHPQARPAAEASECAAEQDKFWEFADKLFENQTMLGPELYQEFASDLGLNVKQFKSCVGSRKYKDKVEADYQEGIKLGVRGTPGSFINGKPLVGAVPYESLKASIEQALED